MKALAHSFFITKERGESINWKMPLVETRHLTTEVSIGINPFAEGHFKYAFKAIDLELGRKIVMKLPKNQTSLDLMSKEIEASNICHHIGNEFNQRIIDYGNDQNLLRDFNRTLIYEIIDSDVVFNYYYAENFIEGEYKK
jgi:hypothetical protein